MPGLTGEVMDKYRVLIAEDDGDIVELLILYLSNAGYDVTAARNGREAVEIIGKGDKDFDMVILDIMMPELNGYEVAMEIRKNHKLSQDKFGEMLGQTGKKVSRWELGITDVPVEISEKIKTIFNLQSIEESENDKK